MASVFLAFFFLAAISSKLAVVLTQSSTIPLQVSSVWFGIPLASGAMIICVFMGLTLSGYVVGG